MLIIKVWFDLPHARPSVEASERLLVHCLVTVYYQGQEQVEEEFMDMAVLRDSIITVTDSHALDEPARQTDS